jgi:hypothetical protein
MPRRPGCSIGTYLYSLSMTVSLRPLSAVETHTFLATSRDGYIEERIATGEDPEAAAAEGGEQIATVLSPSEPYTGQHFYRIENNGLGVGNLWIGHRPAIIRGHGGSGISPSKAPIAIAASAVPQCSSPSMRPAPTVRHASGSASSQTTNGRNTFTNVLGTPPCHFGWPRSFEGDHRPVSAIV